MSDGASALVPRPLEPKPVPLAIGPHAGAIERVALTSDGRAALTSDGVGLRLWPALDASREPIAIARGESIAFTIARDGAGFAIALVGPSSDASLVRVDAVGRVLSDVALGAGAIASVLVADHAYVQRADHAIDRFALDGSPAGRIVAAPGTRIAKLVATRDRAFAVLVDREGVVRGATIEPGADKLQWGTATRPLPFVPETTIVSADRTRFAGSPAQVDTSVGGGLPIELDADGRFRARPCSSLVDSGRLDFERATTAEEKALAIERFRAGQFRAIHFQGDRRVVCAHSTQLAIYDVVDGQRSAIDVMTATLAAAGDAIVLGVDSDLAIVNGDKLQYLGYEIQTPQAIERTALGTFVTDGPRLDTLERSSLVLDADLREIAKLPHPIVLGTTWSDVEPVDDRYLLVAAATPRTPADDLWAGTHTISVFDRQARALVQELAIEAHAGTIDYDPSTGFVGVTDGARGYLVAWDRKANRLADPISIDAPFAPTRIALLDPTKSNGLVALVIREVASHVELAEVRASDVRAAAMRTALPRVARIARTRQLLGGFRAVDRTGRVYVRNDLLGADIGVRDGRVSRVVYAPARMQLVPSLDGKLVAAFADQRASLFDERGHERWNIAVWGARGVLWTGPSELAVTTQDALAILDLNSGDFVKRRCGWSLTLTDKPHAPGVGAPSLCDVQ